MVPITKNNSHTYFRTHNNNFWNCTYKVGRLLSSPLSRFIASGIRLTSNPCHGKKKSTLSQRTVQRLRWGGELLLLTPFVIPGLFGYALRIPGTFNKDSFMVVKPKNEVTQPSVKTKKSLRIFNYNTALMPEFITVLNNSRSPNKRAREIAKLINEEDFDVICLQEVFNVDANEILVEALKEKYPYIVHSAGSNRHYESGVSSGLITASKYPITHASFRQFKGLEREDAMSSKGLLGVALDIGDDNQTLVYNTHSQSRSDGEKYEIARQKCNKQMREWVEADKLQMLNKNVQLAGAFLQGDLNFSTDEAYGEYGMNKAYHRDFMTRWSKKSGKNNIFVQPSVDINTEQLYKARGRDDELNTRRDKTLLLKIRKGEHKRTKPARRIDFSLQYKSEELPLREGAITIHGDWDLDKNGEVHENEHLEPSDHVAQSIYYQF